MVVTIGIVHFVVGYNIPSGYPLCADHSGGNEGPLCPCASDVLPEDCPKHPKPVCVNTRGDYTCNCKSRKLREIDHACAYKSPCVKANACTCASSEGGCTATCHTRARDYWCSCRDGFKLDPQNPHVCIDIDECAAKVNPCGCDATFGDMQCVSECINTAPGYHCVCPGVFNHLLRRTNKCSIGNNPCELAELCSCDHPEGDCEATCTLTDDLNDYACSCEPPGFSLSHDDRKVCVDIDECAAISDCPHTCVNTPGCYYCSCNEGYESNDNGKTCIFIDHCEDHNCTSSHPTTHPATCVNSPTGYTCVCATGFALQDTLMCVDNDECAGKPVCPCDSCIANQTRCVNTVGSFDCYCSEGFSLTDGTCVDVDECDGNPCPGYACENTEGSYRCVCPPGQVEDPVAHGCLVIELPKPVSKVDSNSDIETTPATTNTEMCSTTQWCAHLCTDTKNGPVCSCLVGFKVANTVDCVDIDECEERTEGGTDVCGEHCKCINTVGSYVCEGTPGFSRDGGRCVASHTYNISGDKEKDASGNDLMWLYVSIGVISCLLFVAVVGVCCYRHE